MKRLIGRAAVLLALITAALIAPSAAHAGGIEPNCTQPPEHVGILGDCGGDVYVKADISQATYYGGVRFWGYAYAQNNPGITINIAVYKNDVAVMIDSQRCGDFSTTCTYDKAFPCSQICPGGGLYTLRVYAYRTRDGAGLGEAMDSAGIVC